MTPRKGAKEATAAKMGRTLKMPKSSPCIAKRMMEYANHAATRMAHEVNWLL